MSEFRDNPEFRARMEAAVREGVAAYLLILSRAIRAQLSKPGSGRLYRRGNARTRAMRRARTVEAVEAVERRFRQPRNLREAGFHRASRPGEPPAVDTGTLRRSWQIGRTNIPGGINVPNDGGAPPGGDGGKGRRRGKNVTGKVVLVSGTGKTIQFQYGSALRYATIEWGGGGVAARPYIRPVLAAVRDLFGPTVQRAIARNFPPGGAGAGLSATVQ